MARSRRTRKAAPLVEIAPLDPADSPVKSVDVRGPVSPNHKVRSQWFQARTTWPYREAPITLLNRAHAQSAVAPQAATASSVWELAGPTNIGGRMTSVVCHPQNADVVWAGAAGGGVWKSTDAGANWQPLWHSQPTLHVGSLAIDPQNPDILYCGTGEANLSADSYPGVGLFRSTNGGTSWLLLAPCDSAHIPRRIGAIAVDPHDSQHIRLGGLSFSEPNAVPGGMYVSRDGGVTWAREEFLSTGNHWCHAILFHPTNSSILYATFTAQGSKSGIWRSMDGGHSWQQLRQGLPDPAKIVRTSLAIAPSNPHTVYALIGDSDRKVLGVFRSDDDGQTWNDVTTAEFTGERQMSYNNTIAVHPGSPNHVICGGVDLHLTTDGGATWMQVTHWNHKRGMPTYAHADHHALRFSSVQPHRLYDMNDGGMDVSEDGGRTWTNRSNGLAVTMFYDLELAQSDGRFFGGGTQDNGTNVTITGKPDDHFMLTGGDGGWIVIDPANAGHLFSSWYNMNIVRFRASDPPDQRWKKMVLPTDPGESGSMWMVFIAMDAANTSTIFTGSQRVWRTQDDGDTWMPVSPRLDGSPITAIEIASADSQIIYVGTENGGFFRSRNGGADWSPQLQGSLLPGRTITRIESQPGNANVLVVTVANFGHSHVFLSRDGGDNWEDIDHGQLPDAPHHAVVIPPDKPKTIYICSDVGVWVSNDLGATWANMTFNLPNIMVVDLVYQQQDGILLAATYGRSIWRIRVR